MKKDDFMKIVRSKAKETLTEQEENFFSGIGEAIEKALTEEAIERNKQLGAITTKLGTVDEGADLAGIVRNLATLVDEVEKKSKRTLSSDDKFNLQKALEAKKGEIEIARNGGNPWALEFKAKRVAAMMTDATVMTGAVAQNNPNWFEDPEVAVIQYPANFVLDAISSRQVAKVPATLIVNEMQATGTDGTGVVAEGAEKLLSDFKFAKTYYSRKKYAGRIEFTEEVQIDFEQLVLQIIQMFEDQVLRKWNDGVLADIIAYASTYTATALDGKVLVPDVYSVIMAGMAWIEGNNYSPDVLIMNPADLWLAKSTQNSNGSYQVNPFVQGFAGLNLFSSNKIAAGKVLIGTKSTIKEQHSAYIVRSGTYGDQFIKNESTIVGEIFSVLQLPVVSKKSWLYLDIATVIGALAKV